MKERKFPWGQCLIFCMEIGVGMLCGVLIANYVDRALFGPSPLELVGVLLVFVAYVYLAIFIQLVLHETGHLVFGLLTGYEFVSFRIGCFMLVNGKEGWEFALYSLAGTGGQCLMAPPGTADGHFPVALYNLGGSLMNVLTGGLFLLLSLFVPPLSALLFQGVGLIGLMVALVNGIPLKTNMIANDGYNALSLRKDDPARRAFWIQLQVSALQAQGTALAQMPEEWFAVPPGEQMKNGMTSCLGVLACSRLMEERRFSEAEALMKRLLDLESGMLGLYRVVLVSDLAFCEMMGACRREEVDRLLTKRQCRQMKALEGQLSILRTEYARALLCEKDEKKAARLKKRYEKRTRHYPYPAETAAEGELVALAEAKAAGC